MPAIFRTVLENAIADAHFRTWEMPFNSDSSFWTYLDASQPFDDAAGYRRYIARMRDIPRYFDEQIVNMRAGLARGFSVPRATLNGRDAVDRHLHRRRSGEEHLLQAVRNLAFEHSRSRAAGAGGGGADGDPAIGHARLSQAAALHPQRIYPAGADHDLGPAPCPTATLSIGRRCANIRQPT